MEDIAGEQFLSVMPSYGDWINYEVALTDKSGTDDSRIFEGFVHELANKDSMSASIRWIFTLLGRHSWPAR